MTTGNVIAQKKKKKKKRSKKNGQHYYPREREKKKQLEENIGIFVNQEKIHPHSVFSPFWRENILVGLGRKHLGTTIYFPSSLPNQTHTKKVFLPIFSPKFSVHPYFSSNQTHPQRKALGLGLFID